MTIKFRGKSIKTGEWVYGYYLEQSGYHFIISQDRIVETTADAIDVFREAKGVEVIDPKTLGQYTNLNDKNEKEIYGGDMFDCIYDFDGCKEHKLEVYYDEEQAGFRLRNIGECHQPNVRKILRDMKRKEIIGNTTDNSELLTNK